MFKLTRRDVSHECERVGIQLSHFTCSGYGAVCHLLVPFNFQVALILEMFHISYNTLSFRVPKIVCFYLGGSQASFSPTEMQLPKAVSEYTGWKSVGQEQKARGRGWAIVWKRPWNMYLEAACMLWGASWALKHLSQKLNPNEMLGGGRGDVRCVFWTAVFSL